MQLEAKQIKQQKNINKQSMQQNDDFNNLLQQIKQYPQFQQMMNYQANLGFQQAVNQKKSPKLVSIVLTSAEKNKVNDNGNLNVSAAVKTPTKPIKQRSDILNAPSKNTMKSSRRSDIFNTMESARKNNVAKTPTKPIKHEEDILNAPKSSKQNKKPIEIGLKFPPKKLCQPFKSYKVDYWHKDYMKNGVTNTVNAVNVNEIINSNDHFPCLDGDEQCQISVDRIQVLVPNDNQQQHSEVKAADSPQKTDQEEWLCFGNKQFKKNKKIESPQKKEKHQKQLFDVFNGIQ